MFVESDIPAGEKRIIAGRLRVHHYGYWIKVYEAPADTLSAKKRLIEALTRRLFNHVEHGINVPGTRLAEARRAFDGETEQARRRIKGAMLAGALFNRATDIITKLVEIQALGVPIEADNALMRECGEHLQEALSLGRMVLHRTGEEGIDELWGEPFKAFAYPIEAFYDSRYVKIAQAMREIDDIGAELVDAFEHRPMYAGVRDRIRDFTEAAKLKCETLRTDPEIFEVWTALVVAGERLTTFRPSLSEDASRDQQRDAVDGIALLRQATDLVLSITRARVRMPKSTADFVARCSAFRLSGEQREPRDQRDPRSSPGYGRQASVPGAGAESVTQP
jgi:hypothetical protein